MVCKRSRAAHLDHKSQDDLWGGVVGFLLVHHPIAELKEELCVICTQLNCLCKDLFSKKLTENFFFQRKGDFVTPIVYSIHLVPTQSAQLRKCRFRELRLSTKTTRNPKYRSD